MCEAIDTVIGEDFLVDIDEFNTLLLFFILKIDMGFPHVGQAGLKLLTSGDLPALASQSAGITGVSHCGQPKITLDLHVKCSHSMSHN